MKIANKNKISESIFEKLGEKYDHKLIRTTPLKDIPNGLKEELERLYGSTEYRSRRVLCASIINSMFTEKITEFLMSQNLLEELLRGDENLERTSVNSKEYSELYSFLAQKELIEVIEKPGQIGKGQKAKAGRWKWVERSVLRLLSEQWTEDGIDPDDEYESLSNTPSGISFSKEVVEESKQVEVDKTRKWTVEETEEFDKILKLLDK